MDIEILSVWGCGLGSSGCIHNISPLAPILTWFNPKLYRNSCNIYFNAFFKQHQALLQVVSQYVL